MRDVVHFEIVVEDSTMVVPRMLQVLSRRGFMLRELTTEQLDDGNCKLHCIVEGSSHWHGTLPGLLHKLVEVHSITIKPGENV